MIAILELLCICPSEDLHGVSTDHQSIRSQEQYRTYKHIVIVKIMVEYKSTMEC